MPTNFKSPRRSKKRRHACLCGYYRDQSKPGACAPSTFTKYQKRISGPLLDRIDIHTEASRLDHQKLSSDRLGESSDVIRSRVWTARDRQTAQFTNPNLVGAGHSKKARHELTNAVSNPDMRTAVIRPLCKLDASAESLIRAAIGQMNLRARGYQRVLKLSRTIVDLSGCEEVQASHLVEASQYRPKLVLG